MQQELLFWGDYPLHSDETVFGRTSGTGINLSLPVSLTEYCFCWSRRGGAGGGAECGASRARVTAPMETFCYKSVSSRFQSEQMSLPPGNRRREKRVENLEELPGL